MTVRPHRVALTAALLAVLAGGSPTGAAVYEDMQMITIGGTRALSTSVISGSVVPTVASLQPNAAADCSQAEIDALKNKLQFLPQSRTSANLQVPKGEEGIVAEYVKLVKICTPGLPAPTERQSAYLPPVTELSTERRLISPYEAFLAEKGTLDYGLGYNYWSWDEVGHDNSLREGYGSGLVGFHLDYSWTDSWGVGFTLPFVTASGAPTDAEEGKTGIADPSFRVRWYKPINQALRFSADGALQIPVGDPFDGRSTGHVLVRLGAALSTVSSDLRPVVRFDNAFAEDIGYSEVSAGIVWSRVARSELRWSDRIGLWLVVGSGMLHEIKSFETEEGIDTFRTVVEARCGVEWLPADGHVLGLEVQRRLDEQGLWSNPMSYQFNYRMVLDRGN